MLKTITIGALILSAAVARAENCTLDFSAIEGLQLQQRVGLENGRKAGFTIRVFTKTVGGIARVVAVAGRGPQETKASEMTARSMSMSFPELGLTRLAGNIEKKIRIPARSLEARLDALRMERITKATEHLRERMRRERIGLLTMVRRIQKDQIKFTNEDISDIKRDVITRLAGRTRAPLKPAEQLRFDLEKGYVTPNGLGLHQLLYAEARRVALVTHRAFTYLASGLIGAGAASWIWGNPHLAWMAAGGAGLLAAQVGVIVTLRNRPTQAAELRARDAFVSRNLDKVLAADRDIGEMLVLTEADRVAGLAAALDNAGFTELRPPGLP